jgi:flagellar motor switch protein FliM
MNLSQEEITEFAQALNNKSESPRKSTREKQVRSYDFVHPDKLSRVHLKVLRSLFSSLERTWASTLSTTFKTDATVTLTSVEQVTFSAYAESLPERTSIVGIKLGSLPGFGLMNVPSILALAAVDRMTGGIGKAPKDTRDLTQIENQVFKRLIDKLTVDISSAWRSVKELNANTTRFYVSIE